MRGMAAVARPGAFEARIPCPVCGALIHPVAGRCKHCKEDLRSFRTARPGAVDALPRLAAAPAVAPAPYARVAEPAPPPPYPGVHSGVIANPRGQVPTAILPPRVPVADRAPGRSLWRNWPIVVIVLAVVAIVGAVAVMLWPVARPGRITTGAHTPAPPAPLDHMDTNPLPPPSAAAPAPAPAKPDPWAPDRHSSVTPRDPRVLPPAPVGDGRLELMTAALQHYCRARATCPDDDAQLLDALCVPGAPAITPRSCAAAERCLAFVDSVSCTEHLDAAGIENLVITFDDCIEAARC